MKNYFLLFILLILGQNCGAKKGTDKVIYLLSGDKKVEINPGTFAVTYIGSNGARYNISTALENEPVSNLEYNTTKASWHWVKKGISVSLELNDRYLDVTILASKPTAFFWPKVAGKINAFTIPLHQGKYIPAKDAKWIAHMEGNGPFSGSQELSMQFFATNFNDMALVYVIKNMFNNELEFYNNEGTLALKFNHEFPQTVKDKQNGFRIYFTQNNPVAIAKTYKKYVDETSRITTLEEKAKDNPDIRKLYGAPHIYVWNTEFIAASDITNWKLLKDYISKELLAGTMKPTRHLFTLFASNSSEAGKEFLNQLNEFTKEEFVIKYHKNLLARAFSEALIRKDFFNPAAWETRQLPNDALSLISKGIDHLNNTELFRLNKLLFIAAYPNVTKPAKDWGGTPLSMLDAMKTAGIKKAWLGLNDWVPGEMHPEFVAKAKTEGYLIGPYDSYHSMHQPGKERWLTAKFEDTTLYTRAFVLNKNGKPAGGFLGAGRKLNPVVSMPVVKDRMTNVIRNSEQEFNSWFIDCDATGECLDDYTPERMTSQKEDMEARLKRMAWIRDTYKLVIGSEVGNDFAAGTIAYGHGMTTPVVAWSDPDMRKNEESKYYIGGYFSNNGGIPGRYGMQAPIKEKYLYTYFDNRFNVPLFQLVYNNVVITSHHWEWSSLKVPGEIMSTALKEILYNVPPLYHLDEENWNKFRDIITKHVSVFSRTHEVAVKLEMTEFDWLTKDRLVQRTKFGNSLEIVANFGATPFIYKEKTIPGQALLIHNLSSNEYELYRP